MRMHASKYARWGEPAIIVDEEPITHWRRPRAMELFFLLLDSGHPLRKEQIVTALWSDTDEHTNQTLHSTIHYLRKSMGEACIASRNGTYWLDMAALFGDRVWYDVAAFQQHDASAKAALAANDDATARTELLAMVLISIVAIMCSPSTVIGVHFKPTNSGLPNLDARPAACTHCLASRTV